MAQRIGKYKISKRESELSLIDGGTINDPVTLAGTNTLSGATTLSNATVKLTGIPSISQSNVTATGQLFTTASHFLTSSQAAAMNGHGKDFSVVCVRTS
tara:strand:+ start:95 stop:391 length:297 start_codon:yes stop_codon:yes gene_type:complete